MNKIFPIFRILCVFIFICNCSYASEEAFHRGNELFAKEQYDEAIQIYEEALTTQKSANLYFNLANAYLKKEAYGPAVLNYRRALLLAPQDADINANLRLAQRQADLPIDEPDSLTVFSRFLTTNQWILIATVSGWITLFIVVLRFSGTLLSRPIILLGAFATLTFLVSQAGLLGYHFTRNQAVIIDENDATLKVAPTPQSPATASLLRGTTVLVLKETNHFNLVETTTRQTGYVDPGSLERVLPPVE